MTNKKQILNLLKIRADLSRTPKNQRTEKQISRLQVTMEELSKLDAINPGFVEHIRKDIEQGLHFTGKTGRVKALTFVKDKLLPLAQRTDGGFIVRGQDVAILNKRGCAIGDRTMIALKEQKLCKVLEDGRFVLPWLIDSCFVSTIGGAPLEVVKQYIEQQKHK